MNRPAALMASIREVDAGLQSGLTERQLQRLVQYLELLAKWNRNYNLTAVRDPLDMVTQHVADCLAIVSPLKRSLSAIATPRLLDVGSGGGLPGVILAIAEPAWRVVCIDAVLKKAAFIRQVGAELALSNLESRHCRVESIANPTFDVAVSRAFSALQRFVALSQQAVVHNGVWLAMKGRLTTDETEALPNDIQMFHVEQLVVPGQQGARCLVWMRRRVGA